MTMTSLDPIEDPIEKIVNDTIDNLVDILETRRIQLISEVRDKRTRLDSDVKLCEQMKEQLKNSIVQLEFNLKENPLQKLRHKIVDEMKQNLKKIDMEYEERSLEFISETSELEEMLASLGEIVEKVETHSPRYGTLSPKVAIGAYGSKPGEFALPSSVTVNVPTNQIFVADTENGRIQIFSESGEFVNEFGRKYFKMPYGVAINGSKLFVSDWGQHCIIQFKLPELRFFKRIGRKGNGDMEFNLPRQITTSQDGSRILVADFNNHRVGVFDREMKKVLHMKHKKLLFPCDVKTTEQYTYLLSSRSDLCMHIFTHQGEYLHSLLRQGPKSDILKARFFCMDSELNFIISDHEAHKIKIFSPEGYLLHTLGEEGQSEGMFHRPQGVAICPSGGLVSVSFNSKFGLQIFS